MCNFFSAIATRSGDILWDEATDCHEHLITHFKLQDDDLFLRKWIRVEFKPKLTADLVNLDKYQLIVDEVSEPDWVDREKITENLRRIVSGMIVTDDRKILLSGLYVLGGSAVVGDVVNTRIAAMLGSSNVGAMWDSANVGTMWDSANVGDMWDSANVGTMRDSANVGAMRDSANVGAMWDSAKVGIMWDSANVGTMRDSANVGTMRDSAKVGTMRESAKVGTMRESSNVGAMWDSAKVGTMWDSANVGAMRESSSVGDDCRDSSEAAV